MNNKGKSPLLNSIILTAVLLYLCYYFTTNAMWNVATIFVAVLILLLAIGQFLLYIFLFRDKKKK